MKSQHPIANAQDLSTSIHPADVPEEKGKKMPTQDEIRQRAFEIHIERGGIHGCDLDDWMQAERELQEKYNKSDDGGGRRRNDMHTDTIVLAIAKTPAVDTP